MIFYVYVILCNISVYINIHVTCVQHAYGRLYIGRYIYIYIHVQYMLLDCILTPICFMHILPGTGDSEAWARRFRSFQRQPGTPWIHRCFFLDFPMSGPRRGKSTGNSYVNPRNSTSNVSFDMKLFSNESRGFVLYVVLNHLNH